MKAQLTTGSNPLGFFPLEKPANSNLLTTEEEFSIQNGVTFKGTDKDTGVIFIESFGKKSSFSIEISQEDTTYYAKYQYDSPVTGSGNTLEEAVTALYKMEFKLKTHFELQRMMNDVYDKTAGIMNR